MNVKDFLIQEKHNLIVFLIVLLAFVCYSFVALQFSSNYVPTSPDENQTIFFSRLLAEQKSLIYINPLNKEFSTKIFTPRNYVQDGNKTVPGGFIGHYILGGLFYALNPKLLFILSPLAGAVSLFVIYKITALLTTERVSIITVCLTAVFPPFFYWSVMLFNNAIEFMFLLLAIYYILKLSYEKKAPFSYFCLSIIFSLGAIWIRYVDVLFLGLMYLLLLAFHSLFKIKYAVAVIILCSVLLFPMLYANKAMNGSIITAGPFSKHIFTYNFLLTNLPHQIIPLVPFRSFSIMYSTFKVYFIKLFNLFFVLVPLGFIILFRGRSADKKPYVYILLGIFLLFFFYYAGGSFSGFSTSDIILNSSYTRYFLLPYVIFLIFISVAIAKIKQVKRFTPFIFAIYLIFAMNLLITSIISFQDQQERYKNIKQEILSQTDPSGVIFAKYYDKIIYPDRNIALYLLIKDKNPIGKTTDLIGQLLDKGIKVYWLDESWYPIGDKFVAYKKSLIHKNYQIVSIDDNVGLYAIRKGYNMHE